MTTDEAQQLFAYGSWATARIFRATEALTPEQLGGTAHPKAGAAGGNGPRSAFLVMGRSLSGAEAHGASRR
jgi:hypothetical protein